jgi:hypothetical protein
VATALASAQSARDGAVAAGARETDLTAGDAQVQLASDLRRQGHRAQAFDHLRTATSLFATAESSATARRRPPPETAVAPVTPRPPRPTPAPDPAPIRNLIASYGRALERRDLAALKQIYPRMPQEMAQQWQDFFNIARDVHATVEPSAIVIDPAGDLAGATVQCTLIFQNTTIGRRRDVQPCDFRARFARQGTAWVIETIQ